MGGGGGILFKNNVDDAVHPRRKFQLRTFQLYQLKLTGPTGFWHQLPEFQLVCNWSSCLDSRWFPTGNPTGETQRELLLLKSTGITPVKINGNYSCWKSTGSSPVEFSSYFQLVIYQLVFPVTINRSSWTICNQVYQLNHHHIPLYENMANILHLAT